MTTLPNNHAAPVVGQLVTSLAGRDKTITFAVIRTEGEYVYLADGRNRKTETPKKKKAKHIQKTTCVIDGGIIASNRLLYKAICNAQYKEQGDESCPKKML